MKSVISLSLLCVIGFSLAGCEQREAVSTTEVVSTTESTPEETVTIVEVPRYSAQAFFETTSYGLPGSAGHAFSPDGKALLMSSDASGVYNVYSLPLDGGAPQQMTQSTDNAVFAVSWFLYCLFGSTGHVGSICKN